MKRLHDILATHPFVIGLPERVDGAVKNLHERRQGERMVSKNWQQPVYSAKNIQASSRIYAYPFSDKCPSNNKGDINAVSSHKSLLHYQNEEAQCEDVEHKNYRNTKSVAMMMQ
jgi:hypothetical protein